MKSRLSRKDIEIMSPVGSYESLASAIKAGADSVYFGASRLNMRSRSSANFKISDLKKIASICKKNNIKSYLALNTVIYDEDLKDAKEICKAAKEAGITAIIATDISVIQYARSIGLEVHISTQQNVSNTEAVKFFANYAEVIVLARELSLDQIKAINNSILKEKIKAPSKKPVRLELFVHGALCVSIAGKCYMSLASYNASANRGACLQVCRRQYKVTDVETNEEFVIDNKYVMSPKDLCTIEFLDKIINAGIRVLKIEGRGRSPEYVYTTTKCYREAVESIIGNTYNKAKIDNWHKELEKVYNRGFWHGGYYLGNKLGEWSGCYGSKATEEKSCLGYALNFYPKPSVAYFKLESGSIQKGDIIIISGPTTGIIKQVVGEIKSNDKSVSSAKKGDLITFKVNDKVRKNDKLYKVQKRKEEQGEMVERVMKGKGLC